MAKTPKPKKKSTSIHSRAARRAASPGLNLDKTLKDLPATTTTSTAGASSGSTKPHLASTLAFSGDGVRKRKKALTRAQKLQQRKRVERGEVVVGRTEAKLSKSLGRLKNVRERSKDWEVVNGEKRRKKKAGDTEEEGEDDTWVDEVVVMKPLVATEQAGMEEAGPVETLREDKGPTIVSEKAAVSEPVVNDMVDDIF